MNILLRFTLRNMKENKARACLIIFAITLASGLFLGANALSTTITRTYTGILSRNYGSAEIVIYPTKDSPSQYVPENRLSPYGGMIQYEIGVFCAEGILRGGKGSAQRMDILGYDFSDLGLMHRVAIKHQDRLLPFSGGKVIIGANIAEKMGLSLGDMLRLAINGKNVSVKVCAIAFSEGLFSDDGINCTAVVPKAFLNSLFGTKGKSTAIYLKLDDRTKRSEFINLAQNAYPRYRVAEVIPYDDIQDYKNRVSKPFLMMVTTVLLMGAFIIYTSFKVIAAERTPIMATFRSMGASMRTVNLIFLSESLLYGVIGSVTGCFFGIGMLHAMVWLMTRGWLGGSGTEVVFTWKQVLLAFGLSMALSVGSSFLPLLRVAGLPLKDAMSGGIDPKPTESRRGHITGICFILISLILPQFAHGDLAMPVGTICILLAAVGMILIAPLMIGIVVGLLGPLYNAIFGNEGVLALKNLRGNRVAINNVALIMIGISTLIVIETTGLTVLTEVISFYRDWRFQILATPSQINREVISSLARVEGVKGVYAARTAHNVEIVGTGKRICTLEGITPDFFDYMDLKLQAHREVVWALLDSGRNIILSNYLKDKLDIETGDQICLKGDRGPVQYTAAGFFHTIEDNGLYAIITEKYLSMDFGDSAVKMLYIKTDADVEEAQRNINGSFLGNPFWNETVRDIEQRNRQMNAQIFRAMDLFSYLTVLIGMFGIWNNFTMGFLHRRRSLAVLRSMGLSLKQMRKTLFIESMTGGIVGGVSSLGGAVLMISAVPHVLKSLGLSGDIMYAGAFGIVAAVVGVSVSIIASVGPTLNSTRQPVIELLRYE